MRFDQPLWLVVGSLVVLALAACWWLSARRAQTALQTAFNTPLLAHLLEELIHLALFVALMLGELLRPALFVALRKLLLGQQP